MSDKTLVKTEDYAAWLKEQAAECMKYMQIIERGFDEKFSEMGRIERWFNRKLINHLDHSYSVFDTLLTSFCREYTMAQMLLDDGVMMSPVYNDNQFHQNKNVAMEVYENMYGKIEATHTNG